MARTNKTKYTILGALSIRPMSGYEIKAWMMRVTDSFWSESSGQIYPALNDMLKKGLVQIEKTETRGHRAKKIYAITQVGLKVLESWLALPAEKQAERNEFLLKLFFGKNMPREMNIKHIERHQHQMKEVLDFLQHIEKHIQEEHAKDQYSFYWLLTIRHGICHTKTEIEWCDEALGLFKEK